ncbi:hypothetical protein ABD91_00855 [Lysinibacillus sphaericus]|nr:hypothetical protein [Lysinibacillus sphaericus]
MKIKNIMLSMVTAFALFTGATTNTLAKDVNETSNKCTHVQSNKLKSNQTDLFYMYSNDEGHFFLDPESTTENVIFIGLNDIKVDTASLHHGKKFIGTFADDSLWELLKLEVDI